MAWWNPLTWLERTEQEPERRRLRRPGRRGRFAADYEGASTGRRLSGWNPNGRDANAVLDSSSRLLRERSRDLVRNTSIGAGVIRVLVSNLVGEGIIPRSNTGDRELDKQVDDLFASWSLDASAENDLDFYGLQGLAVRSWLESGEVLARRRIRRPEDDLAVPFQIQLLEADFLDDSKTEDLKNGGRVVHGVEFDPVGRRSAFHVRSVHPGDALSRRRSETSRVDADGVAHLFEPLRPGQCRGVPLLAPSMTAIRDLEDYRDAERYKAKVAACVAAFVIGDDSAEEGIAGDDYRDGLVVDSNGTPLETLEPGLIAYVRGNKRIEWSNVPQSQGFEAFVRSGQQDIAAGTGSMYEHNSGDLSRVNFSSYRAGRIEFNKRMRCLQRLIVVPTLCRPVWRWFVQVAIAAGVLRPRRGGYPVKWILPQFEEVDRGKDAAADVLELRTGATTLAELIARKGKDFDDVMEEHRKVLDELEARGLIFDSIPNQTNKAGAFQSDGSASSDPGDSDDSENPDDVENIKDSGE